MRVKNNPSWWQSLRARFSRKEEAEHIGFEDELTWREKWPMYMAVAAQSWVVFQWYADGQLPPAILELFPFFNFVFAVAAAIAFDAVIVMTTMGRREGRNSRWSWASISAAAIFSALVALDVYGKLGEHGDWLHAAYPIVTFLVAQHLAVRKRDKRVAQAAVVPAQPVAQDGLIKDLQEQLAGLREQIASLQTQPVAYARVQAPQIAEQVVAQPVVPAKSVAQPRPASRVAPQRETIDLGENTKGESKKDVIWRLADQGKTSTEIVALTGYDKGTVQQNMSRWRKARGG